MFAALIMKIKFHVTCEICGKPIPFLRSLAYINGQGSSTGLKCANCGGVIEIKGSTKLVSAIVACLYLIPQIIFLRILESYSVSFDLGALILPWFFLEVLGFVLASWFACINYLEFKAKG